MRLAAVWRWIFRNFIFNFIDAWWNIIVPCRAIPHPFRMAFYKLHPRLSFANSAHIAPLCSLEHNRIRIGRSCYINRGVQFCGHEDIVIGNDCAVGFETMFVTVSHDGCHQDRRSSGHVELPIAVGNGVWIGARVTILPGAVIEDGCIIAAGAVVTGRCLAHGLYAGVPARRVKDLAMDSYFYARAPQEGE
jgi:acetyltransferase-like isoleucine patch superfamily enzyme